MSHTVDTDKKTNNNKRYPDIEHVSKDGKNFILGLLTLDEYELIQRERAEYGEIKKGVTYSNFPRTLKTTVETPDKIIEVKYPRSDFKYTETPKKPSQNKKSFGRITVGLSRLELYTYIRDVSGKKVTRNTVVLSLNNERIELNVFNTRFLLSLVVKICNHLGVLGRKRGKTRK